MTDKVEMFKSMIDSTQSAVLDPGTKTQLNGDKDPVTTTLAEIVNERGEQKYNTVEDAIKALKASQEHISTLERENKEYKDKVQEATTMEDILAQLDSTKNSSDDNQNNLSMEDVKKLVSQTLEETENIKTAKQNQETVVASLIQVYGDKAEEQYYSKAEELGLSVEEMDRLAARSPVAVLQYFNVQKDKDTSKSIQGSVNTENFQQYNTSPQEPKPVMYGASTKDLVNAWRAHAVTDTN